MHYVAKEGTRLPRIAAALTNANLFDWERTKWIPKQHLSLTLKNEIFEKSRYSSRSRTLFLPKSSLRIARARNPRPFEFTRSAITRVPRVRIQQRRTRISIGLNRLVAFWMKPHRRDCASPDLAGGKRAREGSYVRDHFPRVIPPILFVLRAQVSASERHFLRCQLPKRSLRTPSPTSRF